RVDVGIGALDHRQHGALTLEIHPRTAVSGPANAGGVLRSKEHAISPERAEAQASRHALIRGRIVGEQRRVLPHASHASLEQQRAGGRVAKRGALELRRNGNSLSRLLAGGVLLDRVAESALRLSGTVGFAADANGDLLIEREG